MAADELDEAADRMKAWQSWNVGDQPVHPYWDNDTLMKSDARRLVLYAIEVIHRECRTGECDANV